MTRIILDCDPGHDDAIALLLALASPEVELLGVTTVAGNQTVEKTTANALSVLDHVGRNDVAVARGATRPLVREQRVAAEIHGETGLDGSGLSPSRRAPAPEHAIDWTAEMLASEANPVTLVATGPLTNVALLLARHPEVERQLEQIVLMGGAIGEGNITPAAEFNIWADPEAAHRVFSSAVKLTMVGLDVTHRALLTSEHVEPLATASNAGRLVANLHTFSAEVHRRRYGWNGSPVHDALAMAHVIDGTLLQTEHRGVLIDIGPEPSRGRTYVDRWGRSGWTPNCHVAIDVDAERFLALLVERIAGLP